MAAMKNNFEQVPLEVVRQVAAEDPQLVEDSVDDTENSPTEMPKPPARSEEWRKLAEAIVVEKDPTKIGELAEKLNEVLAIRGIAKVHPEAPGFITSDSQVRSS